MAAGPDRHRCLPNYPVRQYPDRTGPFMKLPADSLPRSETISQLTLAPSASELNPAFSAVEIWTNTSLPPPFGMPRARGSKLLFQTIALMLPSRKFREPPAHR